MYGARGVGDVRLNASRKEKNRKEQTISLNVRAAAVLDMVQRGRQDYVFGHGNLQTAETYLKSFDRDAVDGLARNFGGDLDA